MDLVTLALAKSYTDKEIQKAEMGDIQLDTGLGKSGYAADSAAVKQYVDEATSKIPNWILLHEQSGRKVQIADYSKNPIDIEKGQSITSNYGNSMSVLASFFAQCYQICSGGLDLNYEIFAKRLAEEGQILVDNNVFIGASHKVSVSWNENPNCYKNITIDQATYQGKRAWMISDLDRDGVLGARTIFILSDGSILLNDLLSTDTTLTERGIPADAKIVGDKIKIVESNIETNINQALTKAKESGEFDGPQGETGPSAIHVGVEAPENEDILVWINPENDDFSDFISTPPTAKVGQTIVVEEVDEGGKPTKWKAIDLPAGGSESGWVKLGDITVAASYEYEMLSAENGVITIDPNSKNYDYLISGKHRFVLQPIDLRKKETAQIGEISPADPAAGTFNIYNRDGGVLPTTAFDTTNYKLVADNVGQVVIENVPRYDNYRLRVTTPVLSTSGLREFFRSSMSGLGLSAIAAICITGGAMIEIQLVRYPSDDNYYYRNIKVSYGTSYGGSSTNEAQSTELQASGIGANQPPVSGSVSFDPYHMIFVNGTRFELWGANDA